MGTKNNPGKFDCCANAEPDEPMFVLLGRDRHAGALVRIWALMRHRDGEDEAKIAEALACGDLMDKYAVAVGKLPDIASADEPFELLFMAATKGMSQHPDGYDSSCDCDLCRSYD